MPRSGTPSALGGPLRPVHRPVERVLVTRQALAAVVVPPDRPQPPPRREFCRPRGVVHGRAARSGRPRAVRRRCSRSGLRQVVDPVALTWTNLPFDFAPGRSAFRWCGETSCPLGSAAAETGCSGRAVPPRTSAAREAASTRLRRRDGWRARAMIPPGTATCATNPRKVLEDRRIPVDHRPIANTGRRMRIWVPPEVAFGSASPGPGPVGAIRLAGSRHG